MTFNQDISTKIVTVGTGTYTAWDTSNVTNMYSMLAGNQYFNQPIGNWDTSNVVEMAQILAGNSAFDQDISTWDVSKVTNLVA
jgi:surface protein